MEIKLEASSTPGYGEKPVMKMAWDGDVLLGAWDIEDELNEIDDIELRRTIADQKTKELDQSFFDFVYFEMEATGGFGVNEREDNEVTDLDAFDLHTALCGGVEYAVLGKHFEGICLVFEKCIITMDENEVDFQYVFIPVSNVSKMAPTDPVILAN